MSKYTVVLIEDERLLGESICEFLSQDYTCHRFEAVEPAQRWLGDHTAHVIISDIRLPGMSGLEFLQWLQQQQMEIPVILITAYSSIKNAVEAIKRGAFDYVSKPLDLEELELIVRRALENRHLHEEVRYHRRESQKSSRAGYFLGTSTAAQRVEKIVQRLVQVEQTSGEVPSVLITGETGTGKGELAKRLHQLSPRSHHPFIEFNCTAVPETMFESELFGHEKGSFTGATTRRVGLFELANHGTLFIDEIGHAPLAIQAKLLKLIEDKRVRRIGGNKEFAVDVRLIAATNLDLWQSIEEGSFREDLYHRLAMVHLPLIPLRERLEDIVLMAQTFLNHAKQKYQCSAPELSELNLHDLKNYTWPGNVRELRNEIERSILLYEHGTLDFSYLKQLRSTETIEAPPEEFVLLPAEGVDLSQVECQLIEQALIQTRQNVSQAAKLLCISRDELRYRIQKYSINLQHLTGWTTPLPLDGISLEQIECQVIKQALHRTKGNVSSASRLLNISRDTLRYRMAKYHLGDRY